MADFYAQINVSGAVSSRNPQVADVTAMLPFFNSAFLAASRINSAHSSSSSRILHPFIHILRPCFFFSPLMRTTTMPAPVIKNATTIWDINVTWPLSSQCGTWDPKGRGVDVWECILARMSLFLLPLPFTDNLDLVRRLLNAVHCGMSRATSPLGGNSLLSSVSLRTSCTGGTSDVDS